MSNVLEDSMSTDSSSGKIFIKLSMLSSEDLPDPDLNEFGSMLTIDKAAETMLTDFTTNKITTTTDREVLYSKSFEAIRKCLKFSQKFHLKMKHAERKYLLENEVLEFFGEIRCTEVNQETSEIDSRELASLLNYYDINSFLELSKQKEIRLPENLMSVGLAGLPTETEREPTGNCTMESLVFMPKFHILELKLYQ